MENRRVVPEGFRFNKALGQNFLTDSNLLDAIAADAALTSADTAVEIGTGAATLTAALCRTGASVYTFEVDERLAPVIKQNLSEFDNYSLFFKDVLNLTDEEFRSLVDKPFKVVANLPYYITTPLIMRFLESTLPYQSLTLTVQKEVAERLCAKEGTPEYGAVTVSVQSYCDLAVTRTVDRKMFFPAPNVDSAVITLIPRRNKFSIPDRPLFRKTVKAVFCARRKTLENNLKSAFDFSKETCATILSEMNLPPMIRGEKLTVSQFVELSKCVGKHLSE